jgi:hypothetical protein
LNIRYGNKAITILPDYGREVKGDGLLQVAEDLYSREQMRI